MISRPAFAAASVAMMIAGGAANAATFDFVFTDERIDDLEIPDRPELIEVRRTQAAPSDLPGNQIGSGVMSYDGDAAEGSFALGDLGNLMLSFTIGEDSWDQDDIVPFLPVFFDVTDRGDYFSGVFTSDFLPDGSRTMDSEVISVRDISSCGELIGSILLDNGTTCFTASPLGGEFGEYAIYASDSVLISTGAMVGDPEFGAYSATTGQPAAVPLPASLPLLALALGGVGYLRSRRET